MKVFLNGGGSDVRTRSAIRKLKTVIDTEKPALYLPVAMPKEDFSSCYEWIKGELSLLELPEVVMIGDAAELLQLDLSAYSFLFIGGGNTFVLLNELKRSGAFEKIRSYLEEGGVVYGGSAGSLIFGNNIRLAETEDPNDPNLSDLTGFDLLNGRALTAHYTNRSSEQTAETTAYLKDLSYHYPVYALPEEVTLIVDDDGMTAIGSRPYYYFENGKMTEIDCDET